QGVAEVPAQGAGEGVDVAHEDGLVGAVYVAHLLDLLRGKPELGVGVAGGDGIPGQCGEQDKREGEGGPQHQDRLADAGEDLAAGHGGASVRVRSYPGRPMLSARQPWTCGCTPKTCGSSKKGRT